MKTLRILTTWLIVLVSFSITSCSKDNEDDSDSTSIVGTWLYDEDEYVITLKLNKNGSFVETYEEYYNGKWETDTSRGTYEYEGNILTFYYDDGYTYSVTVISVTSKVLKINDEKDITTYNKI